jgi:hydrogenase maturation protease
VSATLVLGVGNAVCGDDGAGPAVVARLRRHAPPGVDLALSDGEILGLLAALDGRERVILVDAARSGRPAGTIVRLSDPEPGSTCVRAGSSHALGVEDALAIHEALGHPAGAVVVYAIEGLSFGPGDGLSPQVARAVERVERMVRVEIQRCTRASKAAS